jgi:hypothetical protein
MSGVYCSVHNEIHETPAYPAGFCMFPDLSKPPWDTAKVGEDPYVVEARRERP